MSREQIIYNSVIDNLTYLILNYPKPVIELLSHHNVFFKGKPSKSQIINEVVELIGLNNEKFTNSLEKLMIQFSTQENDEFWGIVKGALGVVGGLIGKKKRRRSSGSAAAASGAAAAQAAAAKRDMERRMQQMRLQMERERREAEERRRREEEARRKREEEAKKKQQTMYFVIGGIAVLGIGVALVMSSKSKPMMPAYQIPQMPSQIPNPTLVR